MNVNTLVTTSWDDGNILDIKLLDLMDKYGIKGTFYISKKTNQLSSSIIKEISDRNDIGAHSINHLRLTKLTEDDIFYELSESKKWLEDIVGKEIKVFCYPYGLYNDQLINNLKKIGFIGARTSENFCFGRKYYEYKLPVTLQVYPHPIANVFRYQWKQILYRNYFYYKKINEYKLSPLSYLSWYKLIKELFQKAKVSSGTFHLWGHSWEIDKHNMWLQLEKVFIMMSKSSNIKFVTNSDLITDQ